MEKHRVLMLLSYFVPDPSSGTFRSLGLANHLAQNGWGVDVVTVSEADISRPDPRLYDALHPRVRIRRFPMVDVSHWLRGWLGSLSAVTIGPQTETKTTKGVNSPRADYFHLSSRAMRWVWPLYLPDKSLQWAFSLSMQRQVHRLAGSADVLYSSSPAHSVHIAAAVLKKTTRRPWVADFRDPWVDNPLRVLPSSGLARAWDRWLEKSVVGGADWIICNTPPMEEAYRARFDGRVRGISTVLNGFESRIFSEDGCRRETTNDKLTVVHAGSLYGQRDITPILEALARLKRERPDVAEDYRFHFLGANTEGYGPLVKALGLDDLVGLAGPVPLDEALAWDRRAHICLCLGLTGTQNQSQVPAKLYQFIGLGKPVLAVAKPGSAIEAVVSESGVQYFLADPDNPSSIAAALIRIHDCWSQKALQFGGNVSQRKRFDRTQTAHAIEAILQRVCSALV